MAGKKTQNAKTGDDQQAGPGDSGAGNLSAEELAAAQAAASAQAQANAAGQADDPELRAINARHTVSEAAIQHVVGNQVDTDEQKAYFAAQAESGHAYDGIEDWRRRTGGLQA